MDDSQGFLDKMNNNLNDGYIGKLDKQLSDIVSKTFSSPQEALLVIMESMFDLFSEEEGHRIDMKFSDAEGCHYKFTLEIITSVVLKERNNVNYM